jgi:hypothetical protein
MTKNNSMVEYVENQILENDVADNLLDHLSLLFDIRDEMINNINNLDDMIRDAIEAVESIGVDI